MAARMIREDSGESSRRHYRALAHRRALLQMLDPEQNDATLDHRTDIPVDLSSIVCVRTANPLSTIPAPRLEHMEVIEVSGDVTEKTVIAAGPGREWSWYRADVQISEERWTC
ncbi:hypothetical protein C8F01DRAFT_270192 [Mycena amicta]|nr:hypothetical protein C8F01DRAFT_270192 [Mycena amicta]